MAQDEVLLLGREIQGIKEQIAKKDDEIKKTKDILLNKPSIIALKESFTSAKKAADDFYAIANGRKLKDPSPELSSAQLQLKILDQTASEALKKMNDERSDILKNDPTFTQLQIEKYNLQMQHHLIIAREKMKAKELGIDCNLQENDPVLLKGCLDKIFDGMKLHPLNPLIDDLLDFKSKPPGTNDKYFKSVQTSSGPVTYLNSSFSDEDAGITEAKKAFWVDYFKTNPNGGNVDNNASQKMKEWLNNYNKKKIVPVNSSTTTLKPTSAFSMLLPNKGKGIEVPSPVLNTNNKPGIEIFTKKIKEVINIINKGLHDKKEILRQATAVHAVRG